MRPFYSVAAVRAAEAEVLARTGHDEIMRAAARAVAQVALEMCTHARTPRILVAAGSGGNGGDGMYAAQFLLERGLDVEAWPVFGTAYAQEQFGGTIVDAPQGEYDLVIDAIAGLGSGRALDVELPDAPVLAVDVPTGIDADTGVAAERFVTATATVTFDGLRGAHVLSPECGRVIVAHIGLGEALAAQQPAGHVLNLAEEDVHIPVPTPGANDDKYSGGVVALCAGSTNYPGAGVLCAAGAVAATPSLVRVIGDWELCDRIITAHPEVIWHGSVTQAGQAQSWVVGPGRGGDSAIELQSVLPLGVPTVVDASALDVVAASGLHVEDIHQLVLLTPHDGEMLRLCQQLGISSPSRIERAVAVADKLGCSVLLKGRKTIIAGHGQVFVVDGGNSYAATAGSGDVLAGILGAKLAQARTSEEVRAIAVEAVCIHARAAFISARTPAGMATTSASRIARAILEAIAELA